jgi:hypothetical protein
VRLTSHCCMCQVKISYIATCLMIEALSNEEPSKTQAYNYFTRPVKMLDNFKIVFVRPCCLINMWRIGRAGYKRHYRVVHEDVVGLYLSAILKRLCYEFQVLTFVLHRTAADAPSIRSMPASMSSCALQLAVHCIETRE